MHERNQSISITEIMININISFKTCKYTRLSIKIYANITVPVLACMKVSVP